MHSLLVLAPWSGPPTAAPPSGRLQRLLRRLRPDPHRPQKTAAGAEAEAEVAEPSEPDAPTPAIDRYLAVRAAATFQDVDDDALRDYRGAWLMQLSGLQELSRRDMAALEALPSDAVEGEGPPSEAEKLAAELEARRRNIGVLQLSLKLVETELSRRGAPLIGPHQGVLSIPEPEDATLCQYCVSRPADTDFMCCGHTGACASCAAVLLGGPSPRCPHCRR
eukprot:EG_transcript_29253